MPLLMGIGFLNYFFLLVRFFTGITGITGIFNFYEKKSLFINSLKFEKNSCGYFLNRNF